MNPYFQRDGVTIYQGDCVDIMQQLPAESVHCCVTSPPYWGLRDYGVDGQLGLEETLDEYVSNIVAVFRQIRRMLRPNGTLWLNMGDCYTGKPNSGGFGSRVQGGDYRTDGVPSVKASVPGLKPKDLVGQPWRLAFALQADGWWLRSDIIWHKPNPMPEAVRDRPTKAHEYIFLLSKSQRYYFDQEAIKEECSFEVGTGVGFGGQSEAAPKDNRNGRRRQKRKVNGGACFGKQNHDVNGTGAKSRKYERPVYDKRNKRTVWTVATQPYSGAHFATFPPKLIEPCILAGCPEGGTVLDPFLGSGTTAEVAQRNGRNCIGIELKKEYCVLARKRFAQRRLFTIESK